MTCTSISLLTTHRAIHIEDEDELEASGIAESDPALYHTILDTKDRLIALIVENRFPFSYES